MTGVGTRSAWSGSPPGGCCTGWRRRCHFAKLVSFGVSALVSAKITAPMQPATDQPNSPRLRTDLVTELAFLWREPLLRATLFAASGYQLVYAGATFALIASLTAAGATPADLGVLFAVGAVGGIGGAVTAPLLQSSRRLGTVVVTMGWTAAAVFASFAWVERPLLAGALLRCIFFT